MFGKRSGASGASTEEPRGSPPATAAAPSRSAPAPAPVPRGTAQAQAPTVEPARSEDYYVTKSMIFGALIEAIDLSQLSRLDADSARDEIKDIVTEIIAIKNVMMSIAEQDDLLNDICNDVLGYGPLEPLLARDDIADIMVNGRDADLHRSRRQDPADQHPLSRQRAADEHLPAHRQPGRPPRRRGLADLRRAPRTTARASTSSRHPWLSTGPASPFVSSRRTS